MELRIAGVGLHRPIEGGEGAVDLAGLAPGPGEVEVRLAGPGCQIDCFLERRRRRLEAALLEQAPAQEILHVERVGVGAREPGQDGQRVIDVASPVKTHGLEHVPAVGLELPEDVLGIDSGRGASRRAPAAVDVAERGQAFPGGRIEGGAGSGDGCGLPVVGVESLPHLRRHTSPLGNEVSSLARVVRHAIELGFGEVDVLPSLRPQGP